MGATKYTLYSDRQLLALLLPLIAEQFLFITVGMADGVMVAFLGEASISAVNMVDMLNGFICNLVFALTTGGAVVIAQHLGGRRLKEANYSARQLLAIKLYFTLGLMLVMLFFTYPILHWFFGDLEEAVMKQSITYCRITALGLPFIGVYGTCTALLRCQDQTRVTMVIALIGNLFNIAGNALLMFVFHWGVAGAAYATLFSRILTMFMGMYVISRPINQVSLHFSPRIRLDWGIIRRILYIGIPSGIENGIFQFGRLIVLGLTARYGTAEIAANSIGNQLSSLSCIVGQGCCLGLVTIIGKSVGAGSEGQLRYYVKRSMMYVSGMHFLWNIGVLAASPLFMCFYKNIPASTMHLAMTLFMIHQIFGLVMWPWSFAFPNVLRSMNDVKFTMFVSVLSMLVVRVGLSYQLAPILESGALAVWWAMIADWVVRITCFVWRYCSGAWKKHACLTSA